MAIAKRSELRMRMFTVAVRREDSSPNRSVRGERMPSIRRSNALFENTTPTASSV